MKRKYDVIFYCCLLLSFISFFGLIIFNNFIFFACCIISFIEMVVILICKSKDRKEGEE